jgi:hypothetical protein
MSWCVLSRWRTALGSAATIAALAISGCASFVAPPPSDSADASPQVVACRDWYRTLDAATDSAGVRDAGATRVAGFAHLRVDRFTASLADDLRNEAATSNDYAARQAALVQRLVDHDLQARAIEIANLPHPAMAQLLQSPADHTNAANATATTAATARTVACATILAKHDIESAPRMAALLPRLQVPDDYITAYRVAGAYAISRLPFAAGVRKLEAERLAVFASDAPAAAGVSRQRYAIAVNTSTLTISTPTASTLTTSKLSTEQLRRILAPPADDPLRIPSPSPAELAQLFAQFAPSFDIDIASNDDQPGTLAWASSADNAPPTITLDTAAPALYHHTATTRYGNHKLLQLVYTLWFPSRPIAPGSKSDLLAGKLDGIVWRVTLSPDGTPLVYDSIHPCGCYHMFFPTPGVQPKPAPEPSIEWAFIPHTLPALSAQERIVVRIAPRTHYIDRVSVEPAASASAGIALALHDYDTLRRLPYNDVTNGLASSASATRSIFSPSGFIEGTDRGERFIFWPMGIARAGSMRQWGKHATAFVGRRHFDDAKLLQERFTILSLP